MPSTQREKLGNCAARMLVRHVMYDTAGGGQARGSAGAGGLGAAGGGQARGSAGGGGLGAAEAVVTLERFDSDETFAAIFGWQRGVLTDLALCEGDAVLVRVENRHADVVREGVVEEVSLRCACLLLHGLVRGSLRGVVEEVTLKCAISLYVAAYRP